MNLPRYITQALILFAAGFSLARLNGAESPAPSPAGNSARAAPENTANPQALAELQAAIEDQVRKNFPGAKAHYEAARKLDPNLKGIDYQLAIVAFNQNDFTAAASLAEKSIQAGQEVAASHRLLGILAGQNKNFPLSITEFQKATEADPANPDAFFNMSESYREMGHPEKAIDALRKAMQRNPADPLYPLKLRLARIEAGDDKSLDKETAAQLKIEPPTGDWLMTAAAIALKRGFFDEAARFLDQSRQTMQPALFFAMLQDPAFHKYGKEPQIAIFYDVKITTGSPSGTQTSSGAR